MKLIVGLGNIGKEYDNTRHNIGFRAIDAFAASQNITIDKSKSGGLYGEFFYHNEKVILLKPQRYINLSGQVIKSYVDFYKIKIEDILVISDDLDMPVGKIKLKSKGRSGGHNGLKDIENHLKTTEYKRLKLGISNNKSIDTKDYVLGKFNKMDKEKIEEIMKLIPNIILDYLSFDFDCVMNKYNQK